MSFMPSFSQDGRVYRDEDFSGTSKLDRRISRPLPPEGTSTLPEMQLVDSRPAASSSALPQRHLVFPDPIAFK
ncbi:hypothetical protein THARTR1_01707 [Trichoderma harzianum]|uniref:Uncharacterized protein n=1 Tax=Trichoderma harzianum TaxID=5544 RepID=A0A2K0ULN9_TRIHA|nr:hypothetical protein THARTR1_01707 [Trichoderma harzianum]